MSEHTGHCRGLQRGGGGRQPELRERVQLSAYRAHREPGLYAELLPGGQPATGFANGLNTTEQWIVSLGTAGMSFCNGCGPPMHTMAATTAPIPTRIRSQHRGHAVDDDPFRRHDGLEFCHAHFDRRRFDPLLSFLAWGDNGNRQSSADGVPDRSQFTSRLNTPEPGSVMLLETVVLGVVMGIRRRRATAV